MMGVEMSASRLLTPYLGATNIIWTIIICLIMAGLALGNLLGGLLADRTADDRGLFRCMAAAALWVALIPFLAAPVVDGLLRLEAALALPGSHIATAVAACFVLFVPPLVLLGMVSPCLTKRSLREAVRTGRVVGRLQAYGTLGSLLGSALPALLLIPWLGVRRTFLLLAGLLLVPCAAHWLRGRRGPGLLRTGLALLLLVALALAMPAGLAADGRGTLAEVESAYQYLRVVKMGGYTAIAAGLGDAVQSIRPDIWDRMPGLMSGVYYDVFTALPALIDRAGDEPVRVLMLGYGGGVTATMLRQAYGDAVACLSVELDAEIVRLGQAYLRADPADRVVIDDGRRYLLATDGCYDLILVDAFADSTIPQNMATREFFALCRQRLSPGGLLAVNATAVTPGTRLAAAFEATLLAVFPDVLGIRYPSAVRSVYLCGDPLPPLDTAEPPPDNPYLAAVLSDMRRGSAPATGGGPVLTDDRNDVERLQLEALAYQPPAP